MLHKDTYKIHNSTQKIMWKQLNTMQQSYCWWMQQ